MSEATCLPTTCLLCEVSQDTAPPEEVATKILALLQREHSVEEVTADLCERHHLVVVAHAAHLEAVLHGPPMAVEVLGR